MGRRQAGPPSQRETAGVVVGRVQPGPSASRTNSGSGRPRGVASRTMVPTVPAPILGVDPGARETGLVLARGRDLLGHDVVIGAEKITARGCPIYGTYLHQVVAAMDELLERAGLLAPAVVAVESLRPPSPHMGLTNVAGAMATAAVIGAVVEWANKRLLELLLVEPAELGKSPLQAYPAELRGVRETKGTGILRHARSAWDVTLVARYQLRVGEAIAQGSRGRASN